MPFHVRLARESNELHRSVMITAHQEGALIGGLYGFLGVRLADYAAHCRPISPSWDTVAMPTVEFRQFARPMEEFLGGGQARRQAESVQSRIVFGAS